MAVFGIIVPAALLDMLVLSLLIRRSVKGATQDWTGAICIGFWSAAIMYYSTGAAIALAVETPITAILVLSVAMLLASLFIVGCGKFATNMAIRDSLTTVCWFLLFKVVWLAVLYVRHKAIIFP